MNQDRIDWKSGRVLFWDMDFLDINRPLDEQLSELKEDLAQIEYPNSTLIDIGWYPEFLEEGNFVVTVVKDENWDEPLMSERCSTIQTLLTALVKAIAIAEQS